MPPSPSKSVGDIKVVEIHCGKFITHLLLFLMFILSCYWNSILLNSQFIFWFNFSTNIK